MWLEPVQWIVHQSDGIASESRWASPRAVRLGMLQNLGFGSCGSTVRVACPRACKEAARAAKSLQRLPYGPRQPVRPLFLSQERGMHALDPSARFGMPSRPMAYRPDAKP